MKITLWCSVGETSQILHGEDVAGFPVNFRQIRGIAGCDIDY